MIETITVKNKEELLASLKTELAKSKGTVHLAVHPFFLGTASKITKAWLSGEKDAVRKVPLLVFEERREIQKTLKTLASLKLKRKVIVIPTEKANPTPVEELGGFSILNGLGIQKIFLAGHKLRYMTPAQIREKLRSDPMWYIEDGLDLLTEKVKEMETIRSKNPNLPQDKLAALSLPKTGCVGYAFSELRKANFNVILLPSFCRPHRNPVKFLKNVKPPHMRF